eukprot:Pgem_evm1s7107
METDIENVTVSCDSQLSLLDLTPPQFQCPATPTELEVDDACLVDYTFDYGTVTDNCDDENKITLNPTNPAHYSFTLMDTEEGSLAFYENVSGTDFSGNEQLCELDFNVKDTIPPTIQCTQEHWLLKPDDDDLDCCISTAPIKAKAYDNCQSEPIIIDAEEKLLCNLGNHTLNFVVKDSSGNEASCTSVVEVVGDCHARDCKTWGRYNNLDCTCMSYCGENESSERRRNDDLQVFKVKQLSGTPIDLCPEEEWCCCKED